MYSMLLFKLLFYYSIKCRDYTTLSEFTLPSAGLHYLKCRDYTALIAGLHCLMIRDYTTL